jgi:hypothetical protein
MPPPQIEDSRNVSLTLISLTCYYYLFLELQLQLEPTCRRSAIVRKRASITTNLGLVQCEIPTMEASRICRFAEEHREALSRIAANNKSLLLWNNENTKAPHPDQSQPNHSLPTIERG